MSNQANPNVLATRYATKEMVEIFNPINKIIEERKFWITVLKLQKKAGLPITDLDIESYEKVVYQVDLESIDKREIKVRHDVKARIEEFNALAGGEKIPRKGGPGITRSDLLIINKTDLAPHVGANLDVMATDAKRMRGDRPFVFTNLRKGDGVDAVIDFIRTQGLLDQ
jgi:hypothetical protein